MSRLSEHAAHIDAQGVRLRCVSSVSLRHQLPSLAHPAPCTVACFGFPEVCMCDSGGPFRSGTPPLPQGLSQKLAITEAHESRPTFGKA